MKVSQHNTILPHRKEGTIILENRIKSIRKKRNISQQELADYLGIKRTSLSKIENMHYYPKPQIMKKISDFFNLQIGDIFFNSNVSQNNTNMNGLDENG